MANEFIIRNGFQSRGDSQVTGSLDVTGGITGSYTGSFTGDGTVLDSGQPIIEEFDNESDWLIRLAELGITPEEE